MGLMDVTYMKLPTTGDLRITRELIERLSVVSDQHTGAGLYNIDDALEKIALAIIDLDIKVAQLQRG